LSGDAASEFRLKNDLADLERVAGLLWNFCRDHGLSEEVSGDIRLAFDEAVSNTIRHGYTDRDSHEIVVRASVAGRKLALEIEDDARAFNPLEAPLPDVTLPVEEKPIGGLGVLLIRTVMDEVDYQRRGDWNVLRVVRAIGRA